MTSVIKRISIFLLWPFCICSCSAAGFTEEVSLLTVTPDVRAYAEEVVKPILDACPDKDKLSKLIQVSGILISPGTGINANSISPAKFILYDKLSKINLGFLITFNLSPTKKKILKLWHFEFMRKNPSDVFFSPSAADIIKTKAAFGCSHYARTFIAVVKALGLVDNPGDLRYVVSCESSAYNRVFDKNDRRATINGHQFVIVKLDSGWIAINTSKGEWTALSAGFTPGDIKPPVNIPVKFGSYPGITFLLRKAGSDYNDDCGDRSLTNLMNIYRSGNTLDPSFKWKKFEKPAGND